MNVDLETEAIIQSLSSIDKSINEIDIEISKASNIYTNTNPVYLELVDQKDTLVSQKTNIQEKIESLIEGIKRKIQMNEQIFWILPTINSDDINSKETVTSRFKYLKEVFKNKVSMIHGKMKKDG